MRRTFFPGLFGAFFVLLFNVGCYRNIPQDDHNGKEYQDIVDSVEKIIPDFNLRPYDHDSIHKQFDVDDYFKVLKNVKIADGYYLDYVYCAIPRYGRPYIYARKIWRQELAVDTSCFILEGVLWQPEILEELTTKYLRSVKSDGTPMGYFQLVVLYLLGDQFFLFDHALYDDDVIICTKEKMEEVLKGTFFRESIPEDIKKKAREIDVTPAIEVSKNGAVVKVVTFSKWKGFQRRIFTFDQMQWIAKKETVTLAPYRIKAMI